MKTSLFIFILFASLNGGAQTSIYQYKLKSLRGDSIALSNLQGKLMLIVNTSTDDTSSTQLRELKLLEEQYRDSGLVVLCIPSNDFGNETNEGNDLQARYSNYPFYISERLTVTGSSRCALYEWLCRADLNGIVNNRVHGDFKKFLINKSGRLVGAFYESDSPLDSFLLESLMLNQ